MPKVLSHVKLMVGPIGAEMPEGVVNQWVEASQLNAERINKKRRAKIPNADEFSARLAGPSSRAYAQMLNPDFVSRKGLNRREIINRQSENLKKAYDKYNQSLNYVFETVDDEPAKRFKERIAKARKHYAVAAGRKILPFAGSRIYGPGLMTIAPAWLTRDNLVEGFLRGGDKIIEGGPILITRLADRSGFRSALAGRLQQAGTTIVDSVFAQTEIKAQNDITNRLVNGLVDPALGLVGFTTGGASHIDYVREKEGGLWLYIKISKV